MSSRRIEGGNRKESILTFLLAISIGIWFLWLVGPVHDLIEYDAQLRSGSYLGPEPVVKFIFKVFSTVDQGARLIGLQASLLLICALCMRRISRNLNIPFATIFALVFFSLYFQLFILNNLRQGFSITFFFLSLAIYFTEPRMTAIRHMICFAILVFMCLILINVHRWFFVHMFICLTCLILFLKISKQPLFFLCSYFMFFSFGCLCFFYLISYDLVEFASNYDLAFNGVRFFLLSLVVVIFFFGKLLIRELPSTYCECFSFFSYLASCLFFFSVPLVVFPEIYSRIAYPIFLCFTLGFISIWSFSNTSRVLACLMTVLFACHPFFVGVFIGILNV